MKQNKFLGLVLGLFGIVLLNSCDKTEEYPVQIPDSQVHWMLRTSVTYLQPNAQSVLKIPVGVTAKTNKDRIATIRVVSSTGVEGTHYTIPKHTVSFPAGHVVDTFTIVPNFTFYGAERRDTVRLVLEQPDITPIPRMDTLTVYISGVCNLTNSILGAYTNTTETFDAQGPWAAYTTTVSNFVSTGPTTAKVTVTGLWNDWGPVDFNIDFADLTNITTTVAANQTGQPIANSDCGDFSPTYAGAPVMMRSAGTGFAMACTPTQLNFRVNVGPHPLGYFGNVLTFRLRR